MKNKHLFAVLMCLFGCLSWLGCGAWLAILIGSGIFLYFLVVLFSIPFVFDKIGGGLFNSNGVIIDRVGLDVPLKDPENKIGLTDMKGAYYWLSLDSQNQRLTDSSRSI